MKTRLLLSLLAALLPAATISAAAQLPGQTGGALEFVVEWTGSADLNLWVRDPLDNAIDSLSPTSPSGGELDSTNGNDGCDPLVDAAQEAARWTQAPLGVYGMNVSVIGLCGAGEPAPITVTVLVDHEPVARYQDSVRQGENGGSYHQFAYWGTGAHPVLEAPPASAGQPTADLGSLLGGAKPTPAAPTMPPTGTGLLGGQKPTPAAPPADDQPLVPPALPETGGQGGPLTIELTWPGFPDVDLDLMVVEFGILVYADEPISPSGGVLAVEDGNNYCEGHQADSYSEVAIWADAPPGEYEINVSFSLVCGGGLGYVLPTTQEVTFTLRVLGANGQELERYDNVRLTSDGWDTVITH